MDKLEIKHTVFFQYPPDSETPAKKYYIGCKAEQLTEMLKKWDVPLTPNLRYPKRNFVTESIVSDIRNKKLILLPELHVYVHEAYSKGSRHVVLDFGGRSLEEEERFYGFIDGGHRLLALRHAIMAGLDVSDIDITLTAYQDYPYSQIKQKAIQLNTVYPHRRRERVEARKRIENS